MGKGTDRGGGNTKCIFYNYVRDFFFSAKFRTYMYIRFLVDRFISSMSLFRRFDLIKGLYIMRRVLKWAFCIL